MTGITLGDMAKGFHSQRAAGAAKLRISQLSTALSTGKAADTNAALRGSYVRFAELHHQHQLNTAFLKNGTRIATDLSAMQAVLQKVAQPVKQLAVDFLQVGTEADSGKIQRSISEARTMFTQTVADLNGSAGGRTLLAGVDDDQPALTSGAAILARVQTHVSGLTVASDIISAVEDWFMAPGGEYDQHAYLGGAASTERLAINQSSGIFGPEITAATPDIRKVLAQYAKVAVLSDTPLNETGKAAVIRAAGQELFGADYGLINLSASVGQIQESVEANRVHLVSNNAAIDIARNSLTDVDQFETATSLQNAISQLDAIYTLTARSAGLSLVGYMR
ncbi:hypothetical protein [Roseicitreum antarcticum]|uniref:Flagellin n=1 Tax=Roseicitreum antarcticum TaxID=564137 RepID=A0A1H2RB50_9RHOB|nr:hypothetical protein [Roseicitreum antarcticum]SDW15899.1 hypothetical protein SAMN04488238_101233 [Roseicitreum antarcticum]